MTRTPTPWSRLSTTGSWGSPGGRRHLVPRMPAQRAGGTDSGLGHRGSGVPRNGVPLAGVGSSVGAPGLPPHPMICLNCYLSETWRWKWSLPMAEPVGAGPGPMLHAHAQRPQLGTTSVHGETDGASRVSWPRSAGWARHLIEVPEGEATASSTRPHTHLPPQLGSEPPGPAGGRAMAVLGVRRLPRNPGASTLPHKAAAQLATHSDGPFGPAGQSPPSLFP